MSDKKTEYPVTAKLEVHVTDGNRVGAASFTCGHGSFPSDDEMVDILERVKKQIPDGFRLMNRAESAMYYLREEKGYRGPNLVIPSSGNWYDADTDVDYSALGDEPDLDDEDEI